MKNVFFLTILSVNSVHRFSEVYLLTTEILLKINNSDFSKIALVGLQYEPVSLNVNKVCFDEEQDIPNTREKSRKSQRVTK